MFYSRILVYISSSIGTDISSVIRVNQPADIELEQPNATSAAVLTFFLRWNCFC